MLQLSLYLMLQDILSVNVAIIIDVSGEYSRLNRLEDPFVNGNVCNVNCTC